MAAAIVLRDDYESAQLRELARQSEDADQVRRLRALALVYDGGSRSAGRAGLQTFRDWVLRIHPAKTADQPRLWADGLRVDFLARPCTA
jgi:hypothetical protein